MKFRCLTTPLITLSLTLFAQLTVPAHGQDPAVVEPGSEATVRSLGLREAVDRAIEDNLGLRISRYEPGIAAEEINIEEGAFDVRLFAEGRLVQTEKAQTFSATQGTESDVRVYSAGAEKLFATGTTVTAETSLNRNFSNALVDTVIGENPEDTSQLSHEADMLLSVRQPLLRDFGTTVNLARIARAQRLAEIERLALRNRILDLVRQTELTYWEVSWAYANERLLQSSVRVAESLLEEARERERIGVATRVDVLQARAALAERNESMIDAVQRIDDAEDRLLSLLGALAYDAPVESDLAVSEFPDYEPAPPEFAAYWRNTLENDIDTSIQEARLEQRQLEYTLANNEARPNLDVVAFGGYIGNDEESGNTAYDNAFDRAGDQWGIALEFSMPWGFQSARATRRQVEKRIDQEQLRMIELKQALYEEARASWRNYVSSIQKRAAAEITLELQEEAFEQERSKYETGVSTFRDVLEAQRDLDDARLRRLNAQRDLVEAEVRMRFAEGTLLERHGFTWEEVEIEPTAATSTAN